MWAYCHRINAGINTNMALESFNKFLKYNILNGNTRITVEKLLDAIDEVVEEKMWKTIANMERPTSNNYQDKVIIKAHKKAEESKIENVTMDEPGKYRVKSSTEGKYYFVYNNQIDICNCLSSICRVCEICIHKYRCECVEYAVKNTMCKHVHIVALFERKACGTKIPGLARDVQEEKKPLHVEYPSENQIKVTEAIEEFITLKNEDVELDETTRRKLISEEFLNRMNSLSNEDFFKWMPKAFDTFKEFDEKPIQTKRKLETQTYFPMKKKKQ